jgi:hypothetical protein
MDPDPALAQSGAQRRRDLGRLRQRLRDGADAIVISLQHERDRLAEMP